MIPAPDWRPSSADYHAASGWSSSMLQTLREDPIGAFRRYILREPGPPMTAALAVGSVADALLLTPEEEPVVHHDGGRASKKFKARQEMERGKLVVTPGEYATGKRIATAVLEPQTPAAAHARAYLVELPGIAQWSYRWQAGGLELRIRVDRLTQAVRVTIGELKTTRARGVEAFGVEAWKRGYHRQAALYRRGVAHALGIPVADVDHVIFFVRNLPPFEVGVCRLCGGGDGAWWEEDADRELDATLERLAELLKDETGASWRHPWELLDGAVPVPRPPAWAKRKVTHGERRPRNDEWKRHPDAGEDGGGEAGGSTGDRGE